MIAEVKQRLERIAWIRHAHDDTPPLITQLKEFVGVRSPFPRAYLCLHFSDGAVQLVRVARQALN